MTSAEVTSASISYMISRSLRRNGCLARFNHELRPRALPRAHHYRLRRSSKAYDWMGPGSDTDRRGTYLPPISTARFQCVPEQLENPDSHCYCELQKFLDLGGHHPPTARLTEAGDRIALRD